MLRFKSVSGIGVFLNLYYLTSILRLFSEKRFRRISQEYTIFVMQSKQQRIRSPNKIDENKDLVNFERLTTNPTTNKRGEHRANF